MRSVSVEQLKRDTTDRSVMPMSINLHAWVTKIKAMKSDRSMTYPACDERTGERQCGKKMQFDQTTQSYKCERHLDTPKSDPEFRYMCTLEIQDHTGTLYPSLIGDAGETLFGMPAEEFHVCPSLLPRENGILSLSFALRGCQAHSLIDRICAVEGRGWC